MQIEKEEATLSLFADDMIMYTEKPTDYPKKVLHLMNKFCKTAGYRVKIHKPKAFFYTSNEISKTKFKKKKKRLL